MEIGGKYGVEVFLWFCCDFFMVVNKINKEDINFMWLNKKLMKNLLMW